jgi:type VI protein secretion system component Hcp
MKNIKPLFVISLIFLASSLQAGLYVKFDNLKGSSMNSLYREWSDASSFSVNGSRNLTISGPGGGAVGKPNWAQFEITKTQDHVTSDLMVLFCTGRPIQTVSIALTTLGGAGQELPIFEIKLSRVTVCSQQLNGSGYELYAPTEVLSLGYEQITWRFTPLDVRGDLDIGNRTSGGWDLVRGKSSTY